MSFNGSGVFTINTAGQPVITGTTISSTTFNSLTADLATGLTTALTKDGQSTPTANIGMGAFKITNLAAGTVASDAARLDQVQGGAATFITVTGTDTLTGTVSPALSAYATGNQFSFLVANTNTGAVTINVDGIGSKAITRTGTTALVAGDMVAGQAVEIIYDGTRFQLVNGNSFTNLKVSGTLGVTGASTFTGTVGAVDVTTTGNTILGNASTDTLNVGNGGLVKDASGNVGIGTTVNNVYDQAASARPLVVQKSDTNTTLNGSLANITIVNSDTTTNNTAQLNFAAITGASTNQYSSASISTIFGARTNTVYPSGILTFSTSAATAAPVERMRIDSSGNLLLGSTSATGTGALRGSYGTGAVTTNFAAGDAALNANTTGANSTALGNFALGSNLSGTQNSAFGYGALFTNTTGNSNSAFGVQSLTFNLTTSNNTAQGYRSLYYNTASNNTAVGYQAMLGASGTSTGTLNTAIGYQAGSAITSGSNNTLVGAYTTTPGGITGANWTVLSDGQANVKLAIDTNSAIWAVNGQHFFNQAAPTAKTAAATLTGAELLTGIITYNGLAANLTMPLGSDLDTAITGGNLPVGFAFEFVVINTGAATATMAVNTNVTFVGVLTVLALASVRWRVRKTAASTFIVYRVSN